MSREELLKLSDEELMLKAKEEKISPLINAGFIGFLGGIILYSVIKNTWGLLTIIPLFFAYKLIKDSKENKELEIVLKERNLK